MDAVRAWPFGAEDLSWIEHRIRDLEQKTEACVVRAPMRAAFQAEINHWRDLRDRIVARRRCEAAACAPVSDFL